MPSDIGPHLLGRKADPETPRAASLYPASAVLPARSARTNHYWYEGGAWLDQGNTGECVGHAFAHRWADSPKTHSGIDHAWAEKLYMEATLLDSWPDNDNDPNGGTSGLAASKAMKNRGEISAYHHITSADELITTLLDVGTVCVGTNWYNSMFKPYSAYGNSYLNVDQMSGVAGGHEFLANGINLMPAAGEPYVRMKNSWGHYTWPGSHSGTARILLDDLFSLVFDQGGDAILITEV